MDCGRQKGLNLIVWCGWWWTSLSIHRGPVSICLPVPETPCNILRFGCVIQQLSVCLSFTVFESFLYRDGWMGGWRSWPSDLWWEFHRFLLNDTTRKMRQNRIHYIMYEANINNKCAFLHHNGERKGHHCRPIVNVGVSSMNWMGHVNIAVYILSLFSIFRRLIPGGGVDGRAGVGHYYYYLLHLEGLGIGQQRVTFLEFCSVS